MTHAAVAERSVNRKELEYKVKAMYEHVAQDPFGEFHFELGRALAQRLGYASEDLDRIPREAVDSFAGVGYHFDLAACSTAMRSSTSGAAAAWTASSPRSRSVRAA